jgi:hypothetical protein
MTHLVASVSGHGHGHLAITAPVLEHLHAVDPAWRITIWSGLPEAAIRRRLHCPFRYQLDELDFGLRMNPDLSVDIDATVADYRAIHENWRRQVEQRAEQLTRSGCRVLLSNISYLNITAAARAGIPAIALSPLNWADLYRHFAPDTAPCRAVFEEMVAAYNESTLFLAPEPRMPMPHFPQVETVAPVVQTGRNRRDEILDAYRLDPESKLLLLALGGQQARLRVDELPRIEGTRWLVDRLYAFERPDILNLERSGMTFPDLLASSDVLICKPGYGAFAEAARLARPVAYIRRPDWPEEVYLIDWLRRQVNCREALPGALEGAVRELLRKPPGHGCPDDGTAACVRRINDIAR